MANGRRRLSLQEVLEFVQTDGSDIDESSSSDEELEHGQDNDVLTSREPVPKRVYVTNTTQQAQAVAEWTEDLTNYPNIPTFDCQPRLNIPETATTPLDFFHLFLTLEMLRHFKSETNRYAASEIRRKVSPGPNSVFRQWKTVTLNEMRGFFTILIHMMLVKTPTVADYWSTTSILAGKFAAAIMSRNRFQAILSFFHVSDNSSFIRSGQPNHDPLHKVRPFYDHLRSTFSQLCYPERNLSIDEAICPWRGRLNFRVYMKDKPHRWGVKLYEISESSSGYVLDFEIYARNSGLSNRPVDVCLRLMRPYLQHGHCLYTDNYYTCPELTELLLEENTLSVGTVRANRVGMPRDLKNLPLNRGDLAYRRKNSYVALRWKDKKDVNLLTTIHNPTEMITVRVGTSEKKKPVAVHDYTQNMAGVDRSDQMMAYHPLRRRTLKWWKKVFFHLLTLTVIQSQILYNKAGRGRHLPLRDFIIDLGSSLAKLYFQDRGQDENKAPPVPLQEQRENRLTSRCFPEPIPATVSKMRPARRCEVCKSKNIRKESTYMCSTCNVTLCVHPCFRDYHSKRNFSA